MHGKLKIYFSVLSFIQFITAKVGIKIKKKVLVDCKVLFHFHHIDPVIKILVENNLIDIYILENKEFKRENMPEYLKTQANIITYRNAKFIKFDLTIALDYLAPWIPHKGVSIFAPHGAGMKSTYAGHKELSKYDVIFSIGTGTESLQIGSLKDGAVIEKIGFIINDQLSIDDQDDDPVVFKNQLKTILYAPSWSNDPAMVMMNEDLLQILSDQDYFNVILKPHPNLLKPEKCCGKNWNNIFFKLDKKNFKVIDRTFFPIQKYMKMSDLLVSDISSVVFEYLYCNKPIVLHINQKVLEYYKGGDSFKEVSQAAFLFSNTSEMIGTIKQALADPEKHSIQRQKILQGKYYNIGKASQAAVNVILEHLGLTHMS